MRRIKLFLLPLLLVSAGPSYPQAAQVRIDPPFWWTGMKVPGLQLMAKGEKIATYEVQINTPGILLKGIHKVENPDYLFIDLLITPEFQAGEMELNFILEGQPAFTQHYSVMERREGSEARVGFGKSDQMYLLMPDRFANGDPSNDDVPGMLEKSDRNNPDGRHGGDLKGIIDHLDYIAGSGYTALWLNPVLENNMPVYSYHGYAITDHYKVDPRLGSNEDYRELVDACHRSGIRVIKDMVLNHCGLEHFLVKHPPGADWVHHHDGFTRSNFRASAVMDPYASAADREKMLTGWFDRNMPDLDQRNPLLMNYLIQNTIWWIEYAGIDGIRLDTQPYPYKEAISEWAARIRMEYPGFTLLGEAWMDHPSMVSYYQQSDRNFDGYNSMLQSITDFPLYTAIRDGFMENDGWSSGVAKLYNILCQDYLYNDPFMNIIFVDNHDVTRFFSSVGHDMEAWKMAITLLFTTRGIPVVLYGTEVLMKGIEHEGHGQMRADFPGGWNGDAQNAFTGAGLSPEQKEAAAFLRKMAWMRREHEALHSGSLEHYIPENGVYAWFRSTEQEKIMVVLNNSRELKEVDMKRFATTVKGFSQLQDLENGLLSPVQDDFSIPRRSYRIFKLIKD